MVEAVEGCALPYLSKIANVSHILSQKKEYLNIPLVRLLKEHYNLSFERFCTMVKTYLVFLAESVSVELDSHELCYHIDIQEG